MALKKMQNSQLDLRSSLKSEDSINQDDLPSKAKKPRIDLEKIKAEWLAKKKIEHNGKSALIVAEGLDDDDNQEGGREKEHDLAEKNKNKVEMRNIKQVVKHNQAAEERKKTKLKAKAVEKKDSNFNFLENNKQAKEDQIFSGEYKFPDGFLWGTATSAYQVEGGIKNNWSEWERSMPRLQQLMLQGEKSVDYICDQACDSYNRYEEDFDLALNLNNNAVRFSLEWARIQPEKDTWDIEAVKHYRRVLRAAKTRGLATVVTLWHWTIPTWLAKEGGWENEKAIEYFKEYVVLVINEFGADIDYWVTLNEPTIHVANGYLTAKFPPNLRRPLKAYIVLKNLVAAHKVAYSLIHKHYPKARVSITQIIDYIEPARKWCPVEWFLAKIFNYFSNSLFLNKIKNSLDYIGVDYYFHARIVWHPPFKKNKNEKITDMGWEIYPKGIYYVLKYLQKYKEPVLILENGLADKDDEYRAEFIKEHLYWVHRAMEEGADVRGYFYWSLLDNFEWDSGYGPKFGLYSVNRQTFERTARPSAKVYKDICRNNRLLT